MIPSLSSSTSAIQAAMKMLDASAKNTANADTDGYKKEKVQLNESKGVGVVANTEKSNEPGPKYQDPAGNIVEGSNVNLIEEVASQIEAENYMKLNVAVLKTASEMEEHLIDILA